MTELDACNLAAELLKALGFELRWASMQSEACYYGLPGRKEVLRVAAHRYGGKEWGQMPVIAQITFHNSVVRRRCGFGDIHVHELVARQVGYYLLRCADLVPLTAKERARREHRELLEA